MKIYRWLQNLAAQTFKNSCIDFAVDLIYLHFHFFFQFEDQKSKMRMMQKGIGSSSISLLFHLIIIYIYTMRFRKCLLWCREINPWTVDVTYGILWNSHVVMHVCSNTRERGTKKLENQSVNINAQILNEWMNKWMKNK